MKFTHKQTTIGLLEKHLKWVNALNLKEQLYHYPNTLITLDVLENMTKSSITYEAFAQFIQQLEEDGILTAVKKAGRNGKILSLAYKYRINKLKLRKIPQQEIEKKRRTLHPAIHLDAYLKLAPKVWEEDLPYIEKIDAYIRTKGFPTIDVPAPERSLALIGDEKWIQEKGGQKLLERLQLWKPLKIVSVNDPFSFAINPAQVQNSRHFHLIVENKTTFDGLLGELPNTIFTTLIYGQGNKISKSIEHFDKQLPFQNSKHTIYYFGDLDWEGINIWHRLSKKIEAIPAKPFYEACLLKQPTLMKTNQLVSEEAVHHFLTFFNKQQQKFITKLLERHLYLPQEVLSSTELKTIWGEYDWTNH